MEDRTKGLFLFILDSNFEWKGGSEVGVVIKGCRRFSFQVVRMSIEWKVVKGKGGRRLRTRLLG